MSFLATQGIVLDIGVGCVVLVAMSDKSQDA
jgi:hypothetical protein